MAVTSPINVLHIVHDSMNRGGIETWLMNLLRAVDRDHFRMDILVRSADRGAYDDDAETLGARAISCAYPRRPWHSGRSFSRVLSEFGPYDAVHSHLGLSSAYCLRLAHRSGVPVRVAHAHNSYSAVLAATDLARRGQQQILRALVRRHATCALACSADTGALVYGPSWASDARCQVLYCGTDLTPFRQDCDRQRLRQELGLSETSLVIGHVGSFREVKNHTFLVQIAREVAARVPDMHLLLVGIGPLEAEIGRQVRQAGLADRTSFLGTRGDVPRLMSGAMDVLVFPSLSEGLGIVMVEAQAAGLPVVYSDGVPLEAEVVEPLCHRLSLSEPAARWAEEVIAISRDGSGIRRQEALAAVETSPFNIGRSAEQLCRLYRGEACSPVGLSRGGTRGGG